MLQKFDMKLEYPPVWHVLLGIRFEAYERETGEESIFSASKICWMKVRSEILNYALINRLQLKYIY